MSLKAWGSRFEVQGVGWMGAGTRGAEREKNRFYLTQFIHQFIIIHNLFTSSNLKPLLHQLAHSPRQGGERAERLQIAKHIQYRSKEIQVENGHVFSSVEVFGAGVTTGVEGK